MVLHKEQSASAGAATISEGDLVIVYKQFDSMKAMYVKFTENFQSRFGCFPMKV